MNKWKYTGNKEYPKHNSEVIYCFPFIGERTWSGYYYDEDYVQNEKTYKNHIFESRHGFLTNEKVYWIEELYDSAMDDLKELLKTNEDYLLYVGRQ